MNWTKNPNVAWGIAAALALIAAIFAVLYFTKPTSEADARKAEANAVEWQGKALVASSALEGMKEANAILQSKLFGKTDSINLLTRRIIHLNQSTAVTADVKIDTIRDTVQNIVQNSPVYAGNVLVPRKGTLDSTQLGWIDKMAVRASIKGIEVTVDDVRFSTDDMQKQITEHIAPGYWIALFSAVGLAVVAIALLYVTNK